MHLPEASDIPKFRCEVSTFFNLLFVEANVLAAGRNAHEPKPQTVGAILVDQFKWIGRVTQRLRHLATEFVANEARKINVAEGNIVLNAV